MSAAANGFTTVDTSSFSITIGGASQLAFATTANRRRCRRHGLDTQPVVTVQDVGGNTVTTATNSASLAITTASRAGGDPRLHRRQLAGPPPTGSGQLRRLQDHRSDGQLQHLRSTSG